MAKYKVKRAGKKLPAEYFRERELREIRRKHKGEIPFTSYIKESHRFVSKYPRQTHEKNHIVVYKGKEYVVSKVSRKGVHLSQIQRKDGLIEGFKLSKPKFVPEKKYSGEAVPTGVFWLFAPL